MTIIFTTGIGTAVGKTLVSAIVTEALQADYWKPIQAGVDGGTDKLTVARLLSNQTLRVHREVYSLATSASPHIAAAIDGVTIKIDTIVEAFYQLPFTNNTIVIEGAGGLLVPINEHQFIVDLIIALKAKVLLVSRNYLGSINHSLLTAAVCKQHNLNVGGWIFNDQYLAYEQQVCQWSGYPFIASIPNMPVIDKTSIKVQAEKIREQLQNMIMA